MAALRCLCIEMRIRFLPGHQPYVGVFIEHDLIYNVYGNLRDINARSLLNAVQKVYQSIRAGVAFAKPHK